MYKRSLWKQVRIKEKLFWFDLCTDALTSNMHSDVLFVSEGQDTKRPKKEGKAVVQIPSQSVLYMTCPEGVTNKCLTTPLEHLTMI